MTRYRIDFLPRIDQKLDESRQRWTAGTVVVSGDAEAERELRAHDADYGPDLVFRATPLPALDEQDQEHYCLQCGGDTREPIGSAVSCDCMPGVRWARAVAEAAVELAEEKAS